MSEYNRAVLGKQAAELGFIRDTFEKVSRLAGVLSFFERDPVLSQYLALKGGTAINLTIFGLPRLSVDIDFDFSENLAMEDMKEIRESIRKTIRLHAAMNGYSFADKSRTYHTLDSDILQYINSAGARDNIKIEINYSLRSHLFQLSKRQIETLGVFAPAKITCLDSVEIFASKIVALLTRAAARDLYDVNNMVSFGLFENSQMESLRKSVVFYLAVGTENIPETIGFGKMDALTFRDIRTRLTPMLKKKDSFDLGQARERVKDYLSELLVLSDNEKQFLSAFRNGRYLPELLFCDETLERVRNHPMALWKMIVWNKQQL